MLRYLGRLAKRMEAVGFLQGDELLRDAWAAYNAVHTVRMKSTTRRST